MLIGQKTSYCREKQRARKRRSAKSNIWKTLGTPYKKPQRKGNYATPSLMTSFFHECLT